MVRNMLDVVHSVFHVFWNIPDGVATLIAGLLAIGAATVAWLGIRAQIASQERIETERKNDDRQVFITGLTAELLVFSSAIIQSVSLHNARALGNVASATVRAALPVFPEPLIYKSLLERIGYLRDGWPAAATITFYANLLDLNDAAREGMAGRPTVNLIPEVMAGRLRVMAINLAEALNGLNNERQFPIPAEVDLARLIAPDGTTISAATPPPRTLQELLFRLAGREVSNHLPK